MRAPLFFTTKAIAPIFVFSYGDSTTHFLNLTVEGKYRIVLVAGGGQGMNYNATDCGPSGGAGGIIEVFKVLSPGRYAFYTGLGGGITNYKVTRPTETSGWNPPNGVGSWFAFDSTGKKPAEGSPYMAAEAGDAGSCWMNPPSGWTTRQGGNAGGTAALLTSWPPSSIAPWNGDNNANVDGITIGNSAGGKTSTGIVTGGKINYNGTIKLTQPVIALLQSIFYTDYTMYGRGGTSAIAGDRGFISLEWVSNS